MRDERRVPANATRSAGLTAATTWPGVWYAGTAMVHPGGVGVPRLPGNVGRRVDRRNGDAAPYLDAIGTGHAAARTTGHRSAAPTSRQSPSAVLARSCGHCEVFTPRWRYTFDRIVNGCPTGHLGVNHCPAELFGVGAVSLAWISVAPARPRRMAHRYPRRRTKRLKT